MFLEDYMDNRSKIVIIYFIKTNNGCLSFQMAPNRFKKEQRERREVTPFSDDKIVPQIPPEWRDLGPIL